MVDLLKSIYKDDNNYSSIPPLSVDEDIITDTQLKAEAFNKFFLEASVIDESSSTLPNTQQIIVDHPTLDNILITEQEVLNQIKLLAYKKSFGPDEISPRFLKEGGPSIVTSLTKLFNLSLLKGKFPKLWKQANVIHLHKRA